MAWNKSMERFG